MPILWKYDKKYGIAYFCPRCKAFQCTGSGDCTACGGGINWRESKQYKGKTLD